MTSTQPFELFRSKWNCKLNHSCPSTSFIIVDLVITFLMIKHVLVRINAFCWRRTWCPPLVMALLSMTNSTVSLQPPLSSTLTPRLWLRTESFQQLHSLFLAYSLPSSIFQHTKFLLSHQTCFIKYLALLQATESWNWNPLLPTLLLSITLESTVTFQLSLLKTLTTRIWVRSDSIQPVLFFIHATLAISIFQQSQIL